MKFAELVFVAALFGIPLWLLSRAWHRYLALDRASIRGLFQMRAGLALISITTTIWLAVFALMILEDYSGHARAIAHHFSPLTLGLTNLFLCLAALACAGFPRKSAPETAALRRAIAASSACLLLIWLSILGNPH